MTAVRSDLPRRPLGTREVWAAWCRRAGQLGLEAGDAADVGPAALVAVGDATGPFDPGDVVTIVDELEGRARWRRPRFRLVVSDGVPALVVDPEGWLDNGPAAWRQLRAMARAMQFARRQELIAAARSEQPPQPWRRVSRRLALTPSALQKGRPDAEKPVGKVGLTAPIPAAR